MKKILRLCQSDYSALKKHLLSAGNKESQAFALCSQAKCYNRIIYICEKLILPVHKELRNQSSVSIEPSAEFQAAVYSMAYESNRSVFDFHTHPFTDKPSLSSTDYYHGTKNAKYLSQYLSKDTAMGMVVFGNNLKSFEAVVWDYKKNKFKKIKRLEVLGSPVSIFEKKSCSSSYDDLYARHKIIPGWQQGLLEKLKVFQVGLGGNGALFFDFLLSLGVGKSTGWIKACDPDILEHSNLPRIPYARPEDVGKSKAIIAEKYAYYKSPELNILCFNTGIQNPIVHYYAKEANLIVLTVDNDGARKIANSIAVRYSIPCLNIATEIIPNGSNYEALGQIQAYIPGKTSCFLCSGLIDPEEAALDLMSEEKVFEREYAGYVRGTKDTPTPSVIHLNGVTSYLAASQFLKLVFGGIEKKEFLHYDQQKYQLISASVPFKSDCPVCGTKGYFGTGDRNKIRKPKSLKKQKLTVEFKDGKPTVKSQNNKMAIKA